MRDCCFNIVAPHTRLQSQQGGYLTKGKPFCMALVANCVMWPSHLRAEAHGMMTEALQGRQQALPGRCLSSISPWHRVCTLKAVP